MLPKMRDITEMSRDKLGNGGKIVLSIFHFKFREIFKASGIVIPFK